MNAVYHQLVATYTSDSDENPQPGTSTGAITPAGRRRFVYLLFQSIGSEFVLKKILSNGIFVYRSRRNAALNSSSGSSGGDWRDKCRQLLDIIWESRDSIPFREPVDTIEHPGKHA